MKKKIGSILPENVNLATPLIIHGEDDINNDFTNVVKIINTDSGAICTGTIISKTWIVTASHCFFKKGSKTPIRPQDVVVEINVYNKEKKVFSDFYMRVESIIVHNDFHSLESNDIALIKLIRAVPSRIPIAKIYTGDIQKLIGKRSEIEAIAVGYGLTKSFDQIRISKAERKVGRVRLNAFNKSDNLITTTMLNNRKQIACSGDSGGPLFVVVDGKKYLLGVVAWGDKCRSEAIYTHIQPYTEIGQMLRDNVPKLLTEKDVLVIDKDGADKYIEIEDRTKEAQSSSFQKLSLGARVGLGAIVFAGFLTFRNTFSFED